MSTFFFLFITAVLSAALFVCRKKSRHLSQSFQELEERVGKLKSDLATVRTEFEKAQTILEPMTEELLAVDSAGRIQTINRAAEQTFGISLSESLGKPYLEVIRFAAVSDLLNQTILTGKACSAEINLFLDGERFFDARAVPTKSGASSGGAVLYLHDITRMRRLERVQREFVANVSHELRTPLTSIQGFAETLLDGALLDNEHNREFVETIHSQAVQLTRLVDDILDISFMESGVRHGERKPVSLTDIVGTCVKELQPKAKKMDVLITAHVPAETVMVSGYESELKRVIINLLENAVKFNRQGGSVTVSIWQDAGKVLLEVKDSGMGIAPEDLPRIFERFFRAEKGRSRDKGGTGLGLAIARQIVEFHSGHIEAESASGQGSIFRMHLPALTEN